MDNDALLTFPLRRPFLHIVFKVIVATVLGSTVAAIASLFRITAAASFIIYLVTGWYIALGLYTVKTGSNNEHEWRLSIPSYLGAMVASAIGSLLTLGIRVGGCYAAISFNQNWLRWMSVDCRMPNPVVAIFSWEIFLFVFFCLMIVPFLLSIFIWLQKK